MEREKVFCDECGKECVPDYDFDGGYGTTKDGHRLCYKCCGEHDADNLAKMKPGERCDLYLALRKSEDGVERWCVTNWPGTLSIMVGTPRKGRHNLAGTRYDVWFSFRGNEFHGVQYGEFSQICRIKCIKER